MRQPLLLQFKKGALEVRVIAAMLDHETHAPMHNKLGSDQEGYRHEEADVKAEVASYDGFEEKPKDKRLAVVVSASPLVG
jgi:hypothetical protein